jgi:hypothetical protein
MLEPVFRSRLDPAKSAAHLYGVRPHKDATRLQDSGGLLDHVPACRRGQLVKQVDASNLNGTTDLVRDKRAYRVSIHSI